MTFDVFLDGEWHSFDSAEHASGLVLAFMKGTSYCGIETRSSAKKGVWFGYSDRPISDGEVPDPFLRVALNFDTGYGGLTWGAAGDRWPVNGVWVADNPNPPETDPHVFSDSGYPLFYEARSTVTLQDVFAVLDEFCRMETGVRPDCIDWVRGELNGMCCDSIRTPELVEDVDPWG